MEKIRNSSLLKLTTLLLILATLAGFFPTTGSVIEPLQASAAPAPDKIIDLADTSGSNPYLVPVVVLAGDATFEEEEHIWGPFANYRVVIPAADSGKTFKIIDSASSSGTVPRKFPARGNNHGITVESGFVGTVIVEDVFIQTMSEKVHGYPDKGHSAAIAVYGSGTNSSPGTKVLLLFEGENTFHSGANERYLFNGTMRGMTPSAGIEVREGATVTFDSIDSTLNHSILAQCSTDREAASSASMGGAAGIGASNKGLGGGNVVIRGGVVHAVAGYHGAGIGDGWGITKLWTGTVLIYGGKVKVEGGGHGAGIGGGCYAGKEIGSGKGRVIVLPGTRPGEGLSTTLAV